MQILIEDIRITKVLVDMTVGEARWYVSGYYITEGKKILGEFSYSSDGVMTNLFAPTIEVQELSGKLLAAVHLAIENQIVAQNEQESISTSK